jgi:hypothetical protein
LIDLLVRQARHFVVIIFNHPAPKKKKHFDHATPSDQRQKNVISTHVKTNPNRISSRNPRDAIKVGQSSSIPLPIKSAVIVAVSAEVIDETAVKSSLKVANIHREPTKKAKDAR